MTDKEFKKLSRAELIEIIYQLELKRIEVEKINKQLKEQMEHIEIKIAQAGSIADAALSVNGVFEAAQKAADQYLQSIYASKSDLETRYNKVISDAETKAAEIIQKAQKEQRIIIEQTESEIAQKWKEFNEHSGHIPEE